MQPITLEKAIEACIEMEAMLSPIGYHCGLTGSTLYKGESTKDIDIIVYPHQISEQKTLNQVIDFIEGFHTNMYSSQRSNTISRITPSTTDKLVVVGDYKGIRVDLFFLQ